MQGMVPGLRTGRLDGQPANLRVACLQAIRLRRFRVRKHILLQLRALHDRLDDSSEAQQ